jgi:hypothetical protein
MALPFINKQKQRFRLDTLAHIVGWVKRDLGTIYIGFAYLDTPQKFEIATRLANPTRKDWFPTVGLTQPTIYRLVHKMDTP